MMLMGACGLQHSLRFTFQRLLPIGFYKIVYIVQEHVVCFFLVDPDYHFKKLYSLSPFTPQGIST
jgi:hypothetical protein